MAGLATRMRSILNRNRCLFSLKHSVKSRRARLRATEFPTFLLTTKPNRETGLGAFSFQFERTDLLEALPPSVFRRAKSRPFLMWQDWGKRREGDDGVVIRTQEAIGLYRSKALTALAAAACDDGATALFAHAGEEPVLALAAQIRWLECAFHNCGLSVKFLIHTPISGVSSRSFPAEKRRESINEPRSVKILRSICPLL